MKVPGNVDFELNDGRAAGRNERGLDIQVRQAESGFGINLVENFPDDVKGRSDVRSTHAEINSHVFADLGGEGFVADQ